MIDTHIHLQHDRYRDDLENVIARAVRSGVEAMILPGTDLESSAQAVALAERYTTSSCAIYAAVGIHPTSAHLLSDTAVEALRDLARRPQVVAIGEIGLDYYWPRIKDRGWHCPEPPVQRDALARQLALALELDLPVIVHDRDAHEDILNVLASAPAQENHARASLRGTLHAYAGGTAHLAQALASGFYLGIDGPVTFPKATELHAVARQVPLDRLLLETDGPYLTPEPHRGKRNEPAYLRYVAERIAELRRLPLETLQQATTENACHLFRC
ncbi:MAG: TatD family hydrolase [Anaerolineae bacterium]|nr:TatD family hydrolase [Anaerolineae bacterium]